MTGVSREDNQTARLSSVSATRHYGPWRRAVWPSCWCTYAGRTGCRQGCSGQAGWGSRGTRRTIRTSRQLRFVGGFEQNRKGKGKGKGGKGRGGVCTTSTCTCLDIYHTESS